MIDGDHFVLDAVGEGEFRRTLPKQWCFAGRAFGGYTAALALAAVLEVAEGRPAATLAVSFLHPGEVGPVEIDVGTLRSGRSASAYRAVVRQQGAILVDASVWVAEGWDEAADVLPPITSDPVPPPDECASLQWLIDDWGALTYADRRNIDYPTTFPGFARGTPHIELWARIDDGHPVGTTEPLPSPQLGDVLHADAHLFDAPAQVTGFQEAWLLSLDLNVTWFPGSTRQPSTDWRHVSVDGAVAARGVTAAGRINDSSGLPVAVMSSQGLRR
jgi:acyl-CoA thioesterase II